MITASKVDKLYRTSINSCTSPININWIDLYSSGRVPKNVFLVDNSITEEISAPFTYMVALIIEGKQETLDYVYNNQKKFSYILSWDKDFLRNIPNGLYYPLGGCSIQPEDRKVHQKTKLISIYPSIKTFGMTAFGVDSFPHNSDSLINPLKDYCYSVINEDHFTRGYFSEKLINCFQSGTIPIYKGAPDIYDYFEGEKCCINYDLFMQNWKDPKAGPDELARFYKDSLPQINKMFKISEKYICPEDYIFEKYPFLFN